MRGRRSSNACVYVSEVISSLLAIHCGDLPFSMAYIPYTILPSPPLHHTSLPLPSTLAAVLLAMVLSNDNIVPPAQTTTACVLFGLCFALL